MATRADNRDGSCREVLTGKHAGKWRVQYVQEGESGRKNRISRIFPTKSEAKEFLRDLRRGVTVDVARRNEVLTLGGWFDWLAANDWPESLDPKTIAYRQGRFNKHVRRQLGHVPLEKIDPLAIRTFYRDLRNAGVGLPTVREIKTNLVRVYNQAITPYGRVPAFVANPFRLDLKAAEPREAVAITPEQAVEALSCPALTASERALLAIYLLAGVRLSEQMAMTGRQLLLSSGLIAIDQAVRLDAKGGQYVGLPKGDKKRMAVMCLTLRDFLCPFAAKLAPDEFLWSCASSNKPLSKKRTYAAWAQVVMKAKLPSEMSPHDCRLTHVNWIEKLLPQVSPTTLKEHVGHSSGSTVTELNYTRPISPSQDILRNGMDSLVRRT